MNQKKFLFVCIGSLLFFSVLAQVDNDAPGDFSSKLQKDPRVLLESFPPFTAEERIPFLEEGDYYPCSDCHDGVEQIANPSIRLLEEEHKEVELVHGRGRFWCLRCHNPDNRDVLMSSNHEPISFNDSFLLCGECHYREQKDFFLGGHGKRLDSWQGEKVLKACTSCHNPHDPKIKSRDGWQAPKPRKGMTLKKKETHAEEGVHSSLHIPEKESQEE